MSRSIALPGALGWRCRVPPVPCVHVFGAVHRPNHHPVDAETDRAKESWLLYSCLYAKATACCNIYDPCTAVFSLRISGIYLLSHLSYLQEIQHPIKISIRRPVAPAEILLAPKWEETICSPRNTRPVELSANVCVSILWPAAPAAILLGPKWEEIICCLRNTRPVELSANVCRVSREQLSTKAVCRVSREQLSTKRDVLSRKMSR